MGAFAILTEDMGLVPSTKNGDSETAITSVPVDYATSSGLRGSQEYMLCTHIHEGKHTHKKNKGNQECDIPHSMGQI